VGFQSAEIMEFEVLKKHKTEKAMKAAGFYKNEGKFYAVKDGDICFFKFNPP
jgi:ribosome-binding ATPase YchF (GTP1/OBG family)